MSDPGSPTLVPVRILGLPLDVYGRSSEHTDELLREFALIREDNSDQVPARLLALIDELNLRFAAFTHAQTVAMQQALARGDREIDLLYEVPPDASDGVVRLAALLQEADDFCRAGDLLTLAARPEGVAFRRWFLEEFLRQIDGKPPRSWSEFLKETEGG
ncbi:MAG TPA: hypothetical protein VHF27_09580 [Acidimicrobiales bacterium]|nr:hypothetical protein [Acidimicrobiales bacterium]